MDSQEPHFLINNENYTKLHNACQYRTALRSWHINKARPLISNFLRLNLAENIAHKCARRTEELEL